MKIILKTIFFIIFNVFYSFCNGENDPLITFENDLKPLYINNSVTKLTEKNNSETIENIINGIYILNNTKQEVNYGYFQPKGWCRFNVLNKSKNEFIMLRLNQSTIDLVQLYKLSNGKITKFPKISRTQLLKDRPIWSNDFVYKMPLKHNEKAVFYLYSERKYGHHACVMSLISEKTFYFNEKKLGFNLAFVIGIATLALLINLAFYFYMGKRLYLFYGLYIFFVLLLILADTGYFHTYFSYNNFQFQINAATSIIYYFIMAFQLLFIIIIFQKNKFRFQFLYFLGLVSALICLVLGLFLLLFPINNLLNWHVIYISYYFVFYLDIYILFTIITSVGKNKRITNFYIFGFLASLTISTILILANIGIIDGINQSSEIFYYTPFIEIFIMIFGFGVNIAETQKEKNLIQLELNDSQNKMITIQEDERKRIGRDLHDDVGNSLAALKTLVINRYQKDLELKSYLENIITDVRQISHNLVPIDFAKYDLNTIIKETTKKFETKNLKINYIEAGESKALPKAVSAEVYRIFGEALNNIIKHSKATIATVQLIFQDKSIVLSIDDNGEGFDAKNQENNDGIGLKNIKLRADLIDAKLIIESDKKGTLILLEITL